MPATTYISPTGDIYINGVLNGVKWAVNSLTFSFPTDASYYGTSYGSGEPTYGFEAFTAQQQAAVRSVLAMYSSVINFTFTEITETSTQHADLRYAESDMPSTAWAYYPSISQVGGDSWYNNSKGWYDYPVVGNYAWLSLIHETGHAMGLKHPHTASGAFNAMPVDHDSLEYTVMSYRPYIGASTAGGLGNEAYGFPQSLMMYDIAGLQELYGANFGTNSGNTVYSWNPVTGQEYINGVAQAAPGANRIFLTIWDGGGEDTYDFSNYTSNLNVNLAPGGWTVTSYEQLANLGGDHYAIGNIANALLYHGNTASLIENAIGGSGNDIIAGNDANNKIAGGIGNDILDGGAGSDTATYSGTYSSYQIIQNANGSWTITDLRGGSFDGTDILTNFEYLNFSDTLVSLNNLPTNPPALQVPTIASFSNDTGIVGDQITSDNTLTFIGNGTAGSTIKIYDGAMLLGTATVDATGAWTFTTATLTNGGHSFTATATDASGTTTSASTALAVTVDTVAPNTPVIASFSPDSGMVGDGITSATTIILSGTAEAGSIVHIYDGATLLGTAAVGANGTWSYSTYDPAASAPAFGCSCAACAAAQKTEEQNAGADNAGSGNVLSNGVHTFTVKAVDAAGNASAFSAALNVTVDTAAPTAPAITAFSTDSGVAGDGITNDNTLALTGTAEAGSTVQVYDGATLIGSATANGSGAWSFATATLTDGSHSFMARATDAAGNVGATSAATNVTVATTPPTIPVIASFSNDSGLAGDGITNDDTLVLAGTAGASTQLELYDGSKFLGTTTTDAGGVWSFVAPPLSDGIHTFTARISDASGNTISTSQMVAVEIDTVAPTVPVIASFSPDSAILGDGITNNNKVVITGGAAAGSVIEIYDGNTLLGTTIANANGSWNFASPTLTEGTHHFTAKAMDVAGNISGISTTLSVTVDTVASATPVITSFFNDSGAVGDNLTNDNTLAIMGVAEPNSTVQVFDGTTWLGTATADASGNWTFTTSTLSDGAHALTAAAVDAAGNIGSMSATFNVTVDTAAPNTPVIAGYSNDSGIAGDHITNANSVTLTGTAEANAHVQVYDGATLLGSVVTNASGAWSFTTPALLDGTHAFTACALDTAGNLSGPTAVLPVTVDTSGPVAPTISSFSPDTNTIGDGITAAQILTLTGTAEADAVVNVYDGSALIGTATADVSGNWNVTTTSLTDGVHAFTARALDIAGNVSAASEQLYVTVDPSNGTNHAPVVSADGATLFGGQTVAASSLFSTFDADRDAVTVYQFRDNTVDATSGIILINGVAQAPQTDITVAADQLNQTSFKAGSASDSLSVRVFDGHVWSDWTNISINVQDRAPVVTASATASERNQVVAASAMFSASDPDGDAITYYEFYDNVWSSTSGHFVVNGVAQTESPLIRVSADQLFQTSFQTGSTENSLLVRAFDGTTWSAWTNISVNIPNQAAIVMSSATTATRNQDFAASSLFSVSDADGDAIIQYQLYDLNTEVTSGYFVVNGVAQTEQTFITLTAEQLAQTKFHTGSSTDTLLARAFDGIVWSDWVDVSVMMPNHSPVVTTTVATVARGQSIAASSLFSTTDADGDVIALYQFVDRTTTDTSGHFVINGVDQAGQTYITVSAADLALTRFQTGSTADELVMRVYDGWSWSDWVYLDVAIPNHAPVVSTVAATLTANQSVAASSLFSTTDNDGDAVTHYQFWDNTAGDTSGYFVVNGVQQAAQTVIDILAAHLANTSFYTGGGTNDVFMRVFDGWTWSDWTALNADVSNHTPVVAAGVTVADANQSLAASSLFTVTDTENDTITAYQFWDHTINPTSGHFVVNGVEQSAQTIIDVSAAQLSQVTFLTGANSDDLYVRAFDGHSWSDWVAFNLVSTPASAAPADSLLQVTGSANDDVLISTAANEILAGGSGNDTFVFAANFGQDVVADFQPNGTGHDMITFSQSVFNDFAAVLAHASQVGSDVVIIADPSNIVTLKNVAIENLQANQFHIV